MYQVSISQPSILGDPTATGARRILERPTLDRVDATQVAPRSEACFSGVFY